MTTVLIAGATGMLGSRIAHHLTTAAAVRDGGEVRLLVRPGSLSDEARRVTVETLTARGAVVVEGDLSDEASLAAATQGVDVIVSAVQGGRDVVVDGQVALARAAAGNGARRFIASDFAVDLFNAPAGAPMFATRRLADEIIDAIDLEVFHILTGGFLDLMLSPHNPGMVDAEASAVTFWGDGTERFDMTTVEDTARLTARLAVDATAAGGTYTFSATQTSMQEIADALEQLTGRTFARRSHGPLTELRTAISNETDPYAAMGLWYQLALATTPRLVGTSNNRYPDLTLTGLHEQLRAAYGETA